MTATRPVPVLRGEERVYFERAAAGELVLQSCRSCGNRQWYLRSVCTECAGTELELTPSGGHGTVYSFTTLYRAGHPSRAQDVPYTIALVDLDEGVRVFSELIEIAPEEVQVGLRVRVRFDEVGPELVLPVFAPASSGALSGGADDAR